MCDCYDTQGQFVTNEGSCFRGYGYCPDWVCLSAANGRGTCDSSGDGVLTETVHTPDDECYSVMMAIFKTEADQYHRQQSWNSIFTGIMKNVLGGHGKYCPTSQSIAEHGIKGKVLQNCINSMIIEYGEPVLENGLCDLVTAGQEEICWPLSEVVFPVLNSIFNQHAEDYIVKSADTAEDAIAKGAKKLLSALFNA